MKIMELKKPQLPHEFYKPSLLLLATFILYSLVMFILPALIARIVVTLPVVLPIRIIMMIPLVLIAQQGIHLLGWVGHEGFHLSLHRNKYVSAFLGIFFSSMVAGFLEIGAAISHWNHHRYTNQSSDPDCEIFVKFKNFWTRLFFARMTANRVYIINTFKMAFNLPLPYTYKLPFKKEMVCVMAWTNIFFSLFWIGIYTAITIYDPLTGIVSIIIPHILLIQSGLRSYVEHAGTGIGPFQDSRTRTSPFSTVFYFFNNYHLEHHLYPSVPCYKLPTVHKYLRDQGFYEKANSPIETGILGAYLHTTSRFMYPEGLADNIPYYSLLPTE